MQYDLNTTDTAMNASLSVFTFATALFPLMWASFGDKFGRRPVYLVSFLISVIGSICCALSVNVGMLIAFRAVSAIGSSSVCKTNICLFPCHWFMILYPGHGNVSLQEIHAQCINMYIWNSPLELVPYLICLKLKNVVVPLVTTLWDPFWDLHWRKYDFWFVWTSLLMHRMYRPIIGGYLSQGLGWRANFWFLAIFAFCIWLCIFLILPETLMKQPKQNDNSGDKPKSRHRPVNPIAPITLLRFPNVALTVSFVGILYVLLLDWKLSRPYTNIMQVLCVVSYQYQFHKTLSAAIWIRHWYHWFVLSSFGRWCHGWMCSWRSCIGSKLPKTCCQSQRKQPGGVSRDAYG